MSDSAPKIVVVGGSRPDCGDLVQLAGAACGDPGRVIAAPDALSALLAVGRDERPAALVVADDGGEVSPIELLRGLVALNGPDGLPPLILLVDPEHEDLLGPALEAGAADALLLPYRPGDLQARLRARLGRPSGPLEPRRLTREGFSTSSGQVLLDSGGWLFGRRILLSLLGGTGITRVVKGVRLQDGRLAAVKLLDPEVAEQDPDWSKRFEREQRLLQGIEHPNLVQVRAGGSEDGIPFLDMDYYPGENLDEVILREGRVAEAQALEIALQVARGLAALHERGIIHRDVKPENILLVEGSGQVRLCDFGLSKPQDDAGLTHEGEILGTAAFIAPEMLTGGSPGFRSDIYALGATLFEMLTGEDAIEPGPTQAMFHDCSRGVPQARALKLIGGDLRPLVSRMLAVDPDDRFNRAEQVVAELERLQAGAKA